MRSCAMSSFELVTSLRFSRECVVSSSKPLSDDLSRRAPRSAPPPSRSPEQVTTEGIRPLGARKRSFPQERRVVLTAHLVPVGHRSLSGDERFSEELVRKLERLPGVRNVMVHEYVTLNLDRVIEALDDLEPVEPVEEFFEIVRSTQ